MHAAIVLIECQVLYFTFKISKKDVDLWQDEPMPVYFIVFDSQSEVAYWLYFQKYIETRSIRADTIRGDELSVEIDRSQVVNEAAVQQWRGHKIKALAEIGTVHHG
jgi:hypothetical protein